LPHPLVHYYNKTKERNKKEEVKNGITGAR